MPVLDFKGKQFVYAHHLTVPFRQLTVDAGKSAPAKGAKPGLEDNLIIHGDNLHALKALLPIYAGRIKCIYIDPPYNTGTEGWCYNDKVNSPLMQEWLKKEANPVDKEDLERHDKWLAMMWPRLQLLRELLADDGLMFISIDDNEVHRLRQLLEEVFNEQNVFTLPLIWPLPRGINAGVLSRGHEYVLLASKRQENIKPFMSSEVVISSERCVKRIDPRHPESIINFPAGVRCEIENGILKGTINGSETVTFIDDIVVKNYKTQNAARISAGWTMKNMIEDFFLGKKVVDTKGQEIEEIYFAKNGKPHSRKKVTTVVLKTMLKDMPDYQDAKEEIGFIFGDDDYFSYPKPSDLVKKLISLCTKKDDLILDSFGGSATTGHAVLALNKEDGGNRKFILVECEDYADKVTAERVRRVIKGVPGAKDAALKDGLGGSFTYCELGEDISIENLLKGNNLPSFDELAAYAFYTATGQTLAKVQHGADYLIGETDKYRVHLVYKPDLAFMRGNESALNMPLAKSIAKAREDSKKTALVFASQKFMGQKELTEMGIVFCQLPYALHRIVGA